jgi:hypothetical protein
LDTKAILRVFAIGCGCGFGSVHVSEHDAMITAAINAPAPHAAARMTPNPLHIISTKLQKVEARSGRFPLPEGNFSRISRGG